MSGISSLIVWQSGENPYPRMGISSVSRLQIYRAFLSHKVWQSGEITYPMMGISSVSRLQMCGLSSLIVWQSGENPYPRMGISSVSRLQIYRAFLSHKVWQSGENTYPRLGFSLVSRLQMSGISSLIVWQSGENTCRRLGFSLVSRLQMSGISSLMRSGILEKIPTQGCEFHWSVLQNCRDFPLSYGLVVWRKWRGWLQYLHIYIYIYMII